MTEESHPNLAASPSDTDREKPSPEGLIGQAYEELHRIAGAYMARESAGHTLQPTALVNEAFLKLVDQKRIDWQGKTHFLAVGAQAMRRILIDHARGKSRAKRGASRQRISLTDSEFTGFGRELSLEDLLALEKAISALEKRDPRQGKVVEMKFFAGLKTEEIAAALDVSKRTVEMEWAHARAWLRRALADDT